MPGSLAQPTLHVEGKDDWNVIRHLLFPHGIDLDQMPRPPRVPEVKQDESVEHLLERMDRAIEVSSRLPIGFVLDADAPLQDRWNAVRNRLSQVRVLAPDMIPPAGFIGESTKFHTRVGVWLMPDNQRDGKLEDLLHDLVVENDLLLPHAKEATSAARKLDPRFPEVDRIKAVTHTWLAWQEVPGLPYGSAIRARYFRHDSPAAVAFVSWFRELFGISSSS